jgi:aryl-alcohol dehydrogenase-like predicted oxidoreductase
MRSNSHVDLILGTAQLVTSYGVTRRTEQAHTEYEAIELLSSASNFGFEILDTAPAYGNAEEVIGSTPKNFLVHTKLRSDVSAQDSLIRSKRNLKTEAIEVMYVHNLETFRKAPREMIQELSGLLELGVEKIGVSIYDEEDWNLVKNFKEVSVIQVPMNIFDRRFSGQILDEMKTAGVSCVVRSAFLQGILLTEKNELRPEVQHLGSYLEKFKQVTGQVKLDAMSACLGWLAGQTGISGVIVGAQSEDEICAIKQAWDGLEQKVIDLSWFDELELPTWEMIDPRNWAR